MEALHPLIQEVLKGKTADRAVEDSLNVQDYDDQGFSAAVSNLLRSKSIAVTKIQQKAEGASSGYHLDCMARGKSYSIAARFYDGAMVDARIKCDTTGYKRGLPFVGWEMIVLRTLFGNDCMKGPEALRFISCLPPESKVPTDMIGIPWVRYEEKTCLYAERAVIPLSGLYLPVQTLLAGDLFQRACARHEGVKAMPPKVQPLKIWENNQERFVVVQGDYDVAISYLLGEAEVDVIIQRTVEETDHGERKQSPDSEISGISGESEEKGDKERAPEIGGHTDPDPRPDPNPESGQAAEAEAVNSSKEEEEGDEAGA